MTNEPVQPEPKLPAAGLTMASSINRTRVETTTAPTKTFWSNGTQEGSMRVSNRDIKRYLFADNDGHTIHAQPTFKKCE